MLASTACITNGAINDSLLDSRAVPGLTSVSGVSAVSYEDIPQNTSSIPLKACIQLAVEHRTWSRHSKPMITNVMWFELAIYTKAARWYSPILESTSHHQGIQLPDSLTQILSHTSKEQAAES